MRRIALIDYGKLELQDDWEGVGKLQPGTVKVNISACGVCGSDIALLKGHRSLVNEKYFGHEFSGTVVETDGKFTGVRPGIRVASELSRTCGQCWNCLNGLPNYCKSMNEALLPGGFAEETLILSTPEYSFISAIPDKIDDVTATLLEPTSCAYRIARQANITLGDNVIIFGMGTMGLIAAYILKSMGAGLIIGVDNNKTKLKKIRQLNDMNVIDSNDLDWLDQVKEIVGIKGGDVVIEATGVAAVLKSAVEVVRPGGKIVVASAYHGSTESMELSHIMRKELMLIGAKGPYPYRKTDGSSVALEILIKLHKDLKKLITVYEYKDAVKAFEDMMSGTVIKAVVRFK